MSMDPSSWLRKALDRRTKKELIDGIVKLAKDDSAAHRWLTAHLKLHMPIKQLLAATRQAIADATAYDERIINNNFAYDYEAYSAVQRNLQILIKAGHLRSAMELSLELMEQGSRQVEASDEGLMTEDIEACLKPVIRALHNCDLPTGDVRAWCTQMIERDRVDFICAQELRTLQDRCRSRPSA